MAENQPLNEDSSAIQAHLTMMQGVINRMAENSRSCKVWCVTLGGGCPSAGGPDRGAAARADSYGCQRLLFLFLDSYYLALERSFIKAQNAFVKKLHQGELESSDVYRVAPTGMGLLLVGRCLGSVSIWLFYPLVVVMVVLAWQLILPSGTPAEAMP